MSKSEKNVSDTPSSAAARVSPARSVAFDLLRAVLRKSTPLDEALKAHRGLGLLPTADRGFARLITAATLRRLGQIDGILDALLEKPLPDRASAVRDALRLGVAQLCFIETKPHAAVDTTVELVRSRGHAAYAGLTNAVLRRIGREPERRQAGGPAGANLPDWLQASWQAAYGAEATAAIAEALMVEPTLDITVASDSANWAARLGGEVLSTGSLRLPLSGNVTALDGYDQGAWWVQDAAAAMPARLFGNLHGKRVIDLCAAPGGKTAQLCVAGAKVLAVDRAEKRLRTVHENLKRLQLNADTLVADATDWQPREAVDAVLLDAPCSATGTIRRHPDILHLKTIGDIQRLTDLQDRLLASAATMIKPGGQMVYCTCSLQPEEGEQRIAQFLEKFSDFYRLPISAAEVGGDQALINAAGELRTTPADWPDSGGLDGFFAARLGRI